MFKKYLVPISLLLLYLVTHLWQLTLLPVFADESIYIRWAQLVMDNWQQYAFFPLNDGKTPLFIWSLIPFQSLFADQLFAARFVAVLVGFLQLFVVKEIVKELGGRKKAQWLSMLLVAILPFWYIYHRFALMDGMMTLFLSLVILTTLKTVHIQKPTLAKLMPMALLSGLFLGLGIWTKIPAVFIVPALPFFVFLPEKTNRQKVFFQQSSIGLSVFIGLVLFVTLRISPAFGQLFHRSSDFSFPMGDVLLHGQWQQTLASVPTYMNYFFTYLTWPVLVLALAGVFSTTNRRKTFVMLAVAVAFSGYFVLFGRVVYSRYFLPVAIPFTVMASINAQALFDIYFTRQKSLLRKSLAAVIVTVFLGSVISISAHTIFPALTDPSTIPFVSSDTEQYLTTWSSGIGIPETVSYIQEQSQNHTIAVATEGRFGTLPDGLLLYFHDRNVNNIYIEGTGQYPVKTIPDFFAERAKNFDQSILVVNSDRMQLPLLPSALIHQYCRPFHASCLQIWDITSQVKQLAK